MKKVLFIFITIGLFVSCRNNFSMQKNISSNTTTYDLSENYFNNLIAKSNLANSRSVTAEAYPDCIYETEIYRDDGSIVLFKDLTNVEQNDFYKVWKEESIEYLNEKLEKDDSFFEMLQIETEAFNETVSSLERSILPYSIDTFIKKYEKNIAIISNKTTDYSRGATSGNKDVNVDDCTLVESSIECFKNNYKKGRILINTGKKCASSSGYIGHASMMSENEFSPTWENDKSARATITSFPGDGRTSWTDQIDGVQKEPIGYWCGDNAAQNVSILDVQTSKWKWFKRYHTEASPKDYADAVKYAEKQINKPYNKNWAIFGMWNTDKFYCSSLVFRSWRETDKEYSLNTNLMWVSPADLYASDNTKLVKSYTNY